MAAEPHATDREALLSHGRVVRHHGVDRLFHWCMALLMLVLLGTGFLPVVGLQFPWVVPHWVAGVAVILVLILHILRALTQQEIRHMSVGPGSVAELGRGRDGRDIRPGKYNLGQRLYHNVVALLVLAACISGALMMVKQDTPLWKRNPYWLGDQQWGWIYVVHGLSAMAVLALVMVHVYFALRPENALYARSMLKGWITDSEYRSHHDPERWPLTHRAEEARPRHD